MLINLTLLERQNSINEFINVFPNLFHEFFPRIFLILHCSVAFFQQGGWSGVSFAMINHFIEVGKKRYADFVCNFTKVCMYHVLL